MDMWIEASERIKDSDREKRLPEFSYGRAGLRGEARLFGCSKTVIFFPDCSDLLFK